MVPTSTINTVNPVNYPLSGSSLIEASAGTGKTWTIAALYLRLVLGHGTKSARLPEEILVLTFTKAAARELRDRIRQRLTQAAEYFRAGANGDEYLTVLKDAIPAAQHEYSAYLLAMAAQSMDMAAISTIHSWCDKSLKQHAFDSGSWFDLSLTEDISAEQHDVVWDYWRRHIAGLPADKYAQVLGIWPGPSSLNNLVKYIDPAVLPDLLTDDLGQLMDEFASRRSQQINELKIYWQTAAHDLWDWLNSLGKGFKPNANHKRWIDSIINWANSDQQTLDLGKGWLRLSPAGVREKYKGDDDLHVIAASAAITDLKRNLDELPTIGSVLYKHALVCLSKSLYKTLSDKSVLNFDGLLIQMEQALKGQNGTAFAQTLSKQYPVVLIDEFQDTDPVQYSIFNSIYGVPENRQDSTVIFIGDPKQSIYRFRGADIYTYLRAVQDCADRIYTLDRNFRSADNMVYAVNDFFSASGKPVFVTADVNQSLDFTPVQANGLPEKLLIADQPAPAIAGLWLDDEVKKLTIGDYRKLAAKACASEIARLLNLAHDNQAFIRQDHLDTAISPVDIAILVNDGKEARLMQQALAMVNIRSVYLSEKTSVYESQQAMELKFWLMACLEPLNIRAVSAALACPSLGIAHNDLLKIKNDERCFDLYIEKFIKYNDIWLKRGILPMLYSLLHDFSVPAALLADSYNGERALTNFLHLADLLQNASLNLDGPQALMHYLNLQINQKPQNEANLLRLESDAGLIRITTIHKSKGLEYPMVFLPFVCAGKKNTDKPDLPLNLNRESGQEWVFDLNNDLVNDLRLDALGEEVRKLYVAITRARHYVWLALKHDDNKRISGISHVLSENTYTTFAKLCSQSPEKFIWAKPADPATKLISSRNENLKEKNIRHLSRPAVRESWWVSSYSALHVGNTQANDYLEYSLLEDELADSIDAVGLSAIDESAVPEQVLASIPRGSTTGTFLHGILQSAAKNNFSKAQDMRDLIARRCAVRGWQDYINDLYDWLIGFLDNEWRIPFNNSKFRLNNLKTSYAELEFLMPVNNLLTVSIDRLISKNFYPDYDRPVLLEQHLNGMFKGYIDLCFQNHDGKYYVLDYKSNYLTDYDDENLIKSMLAMRYDVQLVLYALVLHKQLKMRLPDYDYERDFGGAVYLYLRGLNYPNQGLVSFRPSLELLIDLEKLFTGDLV